MRKYFVLILICATLVLSFALTAAASDSRVYDPDGLLTSAELTELEAAFAEAEQRSGVPHRAYVHDTENEFYVSEHDVLRRLGFDTEDDVAVLLVEKYSDSYYEYELFTYGKAYDYLTDSAVDRVLDDSSVYNAIKQGRLADGLGSFARLSAEEMVTEKASSKKRVIIFSIVAALVSGGAAVAIVVYRYKRKLKSPIYPLSKYANLSLDYSTDNFVGSNVVRTRINNSSGGSGGRSGGGSRGRR